MLPYFLCCSNLCLSDESVPHNAVRGHGGSERGLLYDWKRVLLSELHHYGCNPDFFSCLIEQEKNCSRSLATPIMQSYKGKKYTLISGSMHALCRPTCHLCEYRQYPDGQKFLSEDTKCFVKQTNLHHTNLVFLLSRHPQSKICH